MWTTIGHAWAIEFLQQAMRQQRVAHAYLITGPSQVGKTHLAKDLAAALNCQAPAEQGALPAPCGTCAACRRTHAETYPDLAMITPEGGRLKIEQMRRLQHELSLSPYEGQWRVCIVTEFQTATREASNALLKTLEEPPARVVLILTATDASELLPTIISRCQLIALRAAPTREIAQALATRYHVDPERASLVAGVSGGRVGWAIQAVQDDAVWRRRAQLFETFWELVQGSSADRIAAAESLAKEDDVRDIVLFWQACWRDVILAIAGCSRLAAHQDLAQQIGALARSCTLEQAHAMARGTEHLLEQMEHNVNLRLALEVLLLGWPKADRVVSMNSSSA